jgi:hypothetical protein
MKNLLKSTLVVAVTVGLSACGNDDYKPPEGPVVPTTLDLTGSIVKGSLISAKVQVYRASDTLFTTPLTTDPVDVQTDDKGDYILQVVDATGDPIKGAFLIEVEADEDTTMICDAIKCGTLDRGDIIPATELTGLSLSTFSYSDGEAIKADVNSLTTMATDTILASAALNGSAIDLANVSAADVVGFQKDASVIIGAILGVDLSESNLFTIDIVDASVSASVSTTDSVAATLTLINASLSSLDVAAGSTLSAEITAYVNAVKTVTGELLADPEAVLTPAALVTINNTQAKIAVQVADLAIEVGMDTGVDVPTKVVPTTVDTDALSDTIGDIIKGTGATGGTGAISG